MSLERIKFVQSKFGSLFQKSDLTIFLNPDAPSYCLSFAFERLVAYQTFYPVVDQLETAGIKCVQNIPEQKFDLAIVRIPKSKKLARHFIYLATKAVPKGLIVIDGDKTSGVESVIRDLKKKVKIDTVVSKAHGKTTWFKTPINLDEYKDIPSRIGGGFETQAGVFSSDEIDPASKLLGDIISSGLSGTGADLGGGWGYLTARALETKDIRELHFIEADLRALTLAKSNVNDERAKFCWGNALQWEAPKPLDFIIMNPPFHYMGRALPRLGADFIKVASRNLKKSGSLLMVANRHLPYEDIIKGHFRSFSELSGSKKFKVICAENPIKL